MRSNRQRIWLTGFAIGWGIFILIVLLGAGTGIARGVTKSYLRECDDAISVTPGSTSMGFGGYNKDRKIVFPFDDAQRIQDQMDGDILQHFPELLVQSQLSVGNEYCSRNIWGEKPGYGCILDQHIICGRDLSVVDDQQHRKVCVLSRNTARLLFGREDRAVGQYVRMENVAFRVVGVYATNRSYVINNDVYVPFETLSKVFVHSDELYDIVFKIRPMADAEENDLFTARLRETIAAMKCCSAQDMQAFKITNNYSDHITLLNSISGLIFFIWFVGIATLISGIVGISNIMSITVRERTREFGVLRAMGASASYIFRLVLVEAVMIALFFGYIGLMLGILVVQLLAYGQAGMEEGKDNLLGDPSLGLGLVGAVTLIIVLAGMVAGYIPARKAVKMKLIDALTAI